MKKEIGCIIATYTMEALMRVAMGIVIKNNVYPKCTSVEKALVLSGSCIGAWFLGREFDKRFLKWCDIVFDTDFKEVTDAL